MAALLTTAASKSFSGTPPMPQASAHSATARLSSQPRPPAGRDRLIMAAYALPVTLGRVSMASASLAIVGARTLPQPPTGYAIPSKRDLRVSRYGRASGMSRSSRRA